MQKSHSACFENPTPLPRTPKYRARVCNAEIMPENLLWRAILCQGIKDVYDNNSRVRSEAIRWLVSRDFVTTCDNALVEADHSRIDRQSGDNAPPDGSTVQRGTQELYRWRGLMEPSTGIEPVTIALQGHCSTD